MRPMRRSSAARAAQREPYPDRRRQECGRCNARPGQAKATELLQVLQKTPGRFAELARTQSQDPGSAVQDGSLGSFGRGMMVKPFEDAVFSMKPNESADRWRVISATTSSVWMAFSPHRLRRWPRCAPQSLRNCANSRRKRPLRKWPTASAIWCTRTPSLCSGSCSCQADGSAKRLDDGKECAAALQSCRLVSRAVQPGVNQVEAEHRGHRGAARHPDGGAGDRTSSGTAASAG